MSKTVLQPAQSAFSFLFFWCNCVLDLVVPLPFDCDTECTAGCQP